MLRSALLVFGSCLILTGTIYGQNTPSNTGVPSPTQTVHGTYPAYNNGAPVNYVRSWTPQRPFTNEAEVTDAARTVAEVARNTQYADGLSRPIQSVNWQAGPKNSSGQSYDVVAPTVYDNLGLEAYQYLPYSYAPGAGGTGTTNGQLKADPFTEQHGFYHTDYPIQQPAYTGEQVYYSQHPYEASPLRRPTQTLAPGNSWAGSGRGISMAYGYNTDEEVFQWDYPTTDMGSIPTTGQNYQAGQLYRTITTDEQGQRVVEYKDKDGHVVLKKVAMPDDNFPVPDITVHDGWLCTYYVYDDLGRLRTVIPPLATQQVLQNGTVLDGSIYSELCFHYDYDQRDRPIVKQVPGAGEVWMVYDARDRLIMTQDANLRGNNQWLVTQYDALDRPISTLLLNDGNDRDYHQDNAYSSTSYPSLSGASYEQLTQTFYDGYGWASGITGISSSLNNFYTGSGDYITPNTSPLYAQPVVATTQTTGMVTGSKTEVLGSSGHTYLYTANFYDDKGRLIQVQSTNYAGGSDVVTTQYDFIGKPLQTHDLHVNPQVSTQPIRVLTVNSYDHAGRVLSIQKKINDEPIKTIVKNTYDQLGQLLTKQLGTDPTSTATPPAPLETLDYTYNIRGWLTGINRGLANAQAYPTEATTESNRWFGMQLSYDYGFTNSQYNGNIAGTTWGTKGSGVQRAYGYAYDGANRLLQADFTQYTSSSWGQSAGVVFDVTMGGDATDHPNAYDANGNILLMKQWGLKNGASAQVDDLLYSYANNNISNKLLAVTDNITGPTTLGDFSDGAGGGGSTDYSYDNNGNMQTDANKGISHIFYNYLNLPATIFADKGNISYTYDAAGNKLRKIVADASASPTKTTTTTYIGSFVYEQVNSDPTTLQFIGHEEGRIRPVTPTTFNNSNDYAFDYFVKDHLGNTRVVLTEEQRQHIYPVASLEEAKIATEESYYTIDAGKIVDITLNPVSGLPVYTNDNGIGDNPVDPTFSATNSNKVYRLNGSGGGQTGLGITLHVMAGDVIDIFGKSYYNQANTGDNSSNNLPIAAIISGLLNTPGGAIASSHTGVTDAIVNTASGGDISTFIGTTDRVPTTSAVPRAYLNYIFFDEQFNYAGVSHAFNVGTSGVLQDYTGEAVLHGIQAPKNGYVYVYCSNESPVEVFFDNIQVVHTHSPLTEETHYYPFGLAMAGISSKAAGSLENRFKFNGGSEFEHREFSDGNGLDWYDTHFRKLDPQIGRWWQIDPKPNEAESPYAAMSNNPILYNDALGDTIDLPNASAPFIDKFFDAIQYLADHDIADDYLELIARPEHISIYEITDPEEDDRSLRDAPAIFWSPTAGLLISKNRVLSPAANLDHEFDHQLQRLKHPGQYKKDVETPDENYDNKEEKRVITGREQKVARALGEIGPKDITRTRHSTFSVQVNGPRDHPLQKMGDKELKDNMDQMLKNLRNREKQDKQNRQEHPGSAGPATPGN